MRVALMNKILSKESLYGWDVRVSDSGYITLNSKKEIVVKPECTLGMFLHEVAHAKTGEGHTGKFADEFTRLVDKYTKERRTIKTVSKLQMKERNKDIKKLRDAGHSLRYIGELYGLNYERIRQITKQ